MVPLIGFAPDLETSTPGVLTDCTALVPTLRGMEAARSETDPGYSALAAACQGAVSVVKLDATRRMFAGTATKLYELVSGAWTDRSRGGNYTSSAYRWRFAQFGNVSLACNQSDTIQASTTGAFADISGAPKARIIETVAGFVMAFGVDYGSGEDADGWGCSALYDHTAWTPSVTTQAANGRLLDTPGEIRAGRRLGGGIVAYKERSMFLGSYVGPPYIWTWQMISGEVGAISHEAVANTGYAHVFFGADDFWIFDGSRPQSIGAPVREWWLDNSQASLRYKMQAVYDRLAGVVRFHYASLSSSGTLDACLVYHVSTGRWGRDDRSIEVAVEFMAPSLIYDSFGAGLTWDTLPSVAYDTPDTTEGVVIPSVFNTSHTLKYLNGTPGSSSLTTGDVGDDTFYTSLTRLRCRFLDPPTSGTVTGYKKADLGESVSTGASGTISGGKADMLQSSRWHRIKLDCSGSMEIAALDFQLVPDGER